MKTAFKALPLVITLGCFTSGCATIIGDPSQTIPISSSPSQANLSVVDETGNEIYKGTTPTSVALVKSNGSYFGGKTYTVTISKEGYGDQIITLGTKVNGWYVVGNLVFGGLVGWLIVDPLNGNMYTLSPAQVTGSLSGDNANMKKSDGSSISVVLYEDVPADMLELLKPL